MSDAQYQTALALFGQGRRIRQGGQRGDALAFRDRPAPSTGDPRYVDAMMGR